MIGSDAIRAGLLRKLKMALIAPFLLTGLFIFLMPAGRHRPFQLR